MSLEALELEIEQAWLSLKSAIHPRTIHLTTMNHLRWGTEFRSSHAVEVGTYRSSVRLIDFREDVFFALEQRGDRRHG